ncbi:hypothetical protein BJ508DRAFT_141453 [Ascobolus immersus RN42]|uniref:Uncharacterized protein n=1 Tax=Ascobolus immersus RN42 TaxID=1160509 RepID=A0A3N4ICM1_ASCIM|nr:hypothetical protein BJ508DRAFT_141453 [Ascobolus immersus RN42]
MLSLTTAMTIGYNTGGYPKEETERLAYLRRLVREGSDHVLVAILEEGSQFWDRVERGLASDAQLRLITMVMEGFVGEVKVLVGLLVGGTRDDVFLDDISRVVGKMESRGGMVRFFVELRAPSVEERICRYLHGDLLASQLDTGGKGSIPSSSKVCTVLGALKKYLGSLVCAVIS